MMIPISNKHCWLGALTVLPSVLSLRPLCIWMRVWWRRWNRRHCHRCLSRARRHHWAWRRAVVFFAFALRSGGPKSKRDAHVAAGKESELKI
ncbi:hypothetical protein BJX61DRAFT_518581 [Aspergillus egyptiacus]|nr:hypothetical protein BJX61DRAFT_518581 [Aspergillus egyptiacus]